MSHRNGKTAHLLGGAVLSAMNGKTVQISCPKMSDARYLLEKCSKSFLKGVEHTIEANNFSINLTEQGTTITFSWVKT